ncbi:phage tail length tape measure family protein [Oceaniglobus trochenteri]|uniref:phage tail length tape measure family protein n=1 Tax=Oceaniglobus trochenteri TaxID=2763260 RepID=UPI001CFFD381|nr:phage tail length tape measure family protein [Oceaniglobus trochenteri]
MSTIGLHLLIEANAARAIAETAKVAKAVKEASKAADDLRTSGKAAAAGTDALGSSATATAQSVERMGTVEAEVARRHDAAARARERAAMQTAATLARESQAYSELRQAIDPVYAASKRYEAAVETVNRAVSSGAVTQAQANRTLALAEAQYLATGASAQRLGAANTAAAGSIGNLVAQFNDIGVMMAAGQNPLTLALQQGTQITQVIGPMGAAGAVKALGGALLGMLNPVSLITIGSIAAGAAMVGWLTDSGDEAESLEDALSALADGLETYKDVASKAMLPTVELEQMFGKGAEAARRFLRELEAIEKRNILGGDVGQLIASVTSPGAGQGGHISEIRDRYGLRSSRKKERDAAATANFYEKNLRDAEGLEAQIAAAERLYDQSVALADLRGGRTTQEDAYIAKLAEVLLRLREIEAATSSSTREIERQASIYGEMARTREIQAGIDRALAGDRTAALAEQYGLMARSRVESDAQHASAQDLLANLYEQGDIQAAIARHGADSAEVAELRAAAERRAFEQQLSGLDVSEALKDELRAAFENADALAKVDIASNIAGAVDNAFALAQRLGVALSVARAIADTGVAELRTATNGGPDAAVVAARSGQTSRDLNAPGGILEQFSSGEGTFRSLRPPRTRRGGGGRGGGAADERDAAAALIEKLEAELAVLRELDPVQKELLAHRETLAGATADQKDRIGELIAVTHEEERAMEAASARLEEFKQAGYDLFKGLSKGGDELDATFERLLGRLEDMVLQAILLGEGPLADLLGGGSGGVLGTIGKAIIGAFGGKSATPAPVAKADGGMIHGPGGPRDDQVAAWLSNGEFVVNAKATAANRQLLERINAGAIPRFARGGHVGVGSSAGSSHGDAQMRIVIENRGATPVEGEAREEVGADGQRQMRLILADRVGGAMTTRGGGARRALTQAYGVRPKGTYR